MADAEPETTEAQTANGAANVDETQTTEPEVIGVKCVLLDIEGTICPISFVKDTLFPYAIKALPDVLASKWDDDGFKPYRDAFPEDARATPETLQAYVELLTGEDRKDACLKNLQGYLWETGYETGAYSTPLFPDVAPRLKQWKDAGLTLAIYSSGSVFAQKLLFGHVQLQASEEQVAIEQRQSTAEATEPTTGTKRSIDDASGSAPEEAQDDEPPNKKMAADVNDQPESVAAGAATEDMKYLISAWFDTTNAGPKKEASSYETIAKALDLSPPEILFLTDSVEEYDASTKAGVEAGLMMRPGNPRLRREDVNRFQMMWSLQNANPLRENYGVKMRISAP